MNHLPSLIYPLHIVVAAGGTRCNPRGSWEYNRLTCRRSSKKYTERSGNHPGPLCLRGSLKHGAFGHRSRQGRTRVPLRTLNGMVRSHRGSFTLAASPANNSKPGSGHPTPRSADGGGIGSRGLKVSAGRLVVLKATWRAAIRTVTSVLRILPVPHPCERTRETNNSDNSD